MSDLIDRQALRRAMYHEAMEKDSKDQRWDSGCWIRYRMFERVVDSMPAVQSDNDAISRQAAIKAIEKLNIPEDMCVFEILSHIILAIETLPSAERDYKFDEWCTDCKEYDKERHCCPRFNKVIRTALQEVQENQKNGEIYEWMKDTFAIALEEF